MPLKLPPEHHIVRNASWAKLRKDDDDPERVVGVLGEAFKMRAVDDYLSSTSLEYFSGERQEQIVAAARAMRASKLTISPKSAFIVGNVGKIAAIALSREYTLRILHEPEDDNKAHVAVRRFPRDDMELFELLASDGWNDVVLNSAIPPGQASAPDTPAWTLPD